MASTTTIKHKNEIENQMMVTIQRNKIDEDRLKFQKKYEILKQKKEYIMNILSESDTRQLSYNKIKKYRKALIKIDIELKSTKKINNSYINNANIQYYKGKLLNMVVLTLI